MEWILYAALAIICWGAVNIFDKHIISNELRDPWLVTVIFGLVSFLIFMITGLAFGQITVPINIMLWSILAGILYSLAHLLYYFVMRRLEVSSYVPILSTEPLIIALTMFLAWQERLSVANYIGIFLITLGAIIISFKKKSSTGNRVFLVLAFLSVLLFSGRSLILDQLSEQADFWAVIFWFGLGGIILPLVIYLFHHPALKRQAEEGIVHLVFTSALSAAGLLSISKAFTLGSVSLVSAFLSTKPLLVFLVVTFLSFFHPKFIRERHSPQVLFQKVLATLVIVVGSLLLIF